MPYIQSDVVSPAASPTQNCPTNVAFAVAKPAMAERLGDELLKLVAPTRAEPGCQRYEIHQSARDPHVWMIIETWGARTDFDTHMQRSYVRDFLAQVPSLCVRDVEIAEYHEASAHHYPRRRKS